MRNNMFIQSLLFGMVLGLVQQVVVNPIVARTMIRKWGEFIMAIETKIPKNITLDYVLTLSVIGLGFTLYNIFVAPSVERIKPF